MQQELLKPRDACREISISYQTLKKWIYQGKIKSVTTPGGHHRIPRSEINRLRLPGKGHRQRSGEEVSLDAISGRNKLLGTVVAIGFQGLLAEVILDIGGQQITSIITRRACETLGLKKSARAFALIKATEVMIIRG